MSAIYVWEEGQHLSIGPARLIRVCLLGRLRDAKGGDEARFSLLMGPLGAKLVGRGSPSDHLALMQAVLAARGIRIVEERAPAPAAPSSLPPPPRQQHLYHQQVFPHRAALSIGTPVLLLSIAGIYT